MTHADRNDDPAAGLARAARAGGEVAFRRLVEASYRKIHRWALARTGDPDDADEVVQRVLLRLHRYLDGWNERGRFDSWLYRITANAAASLKAEEEHEAEARRRRARHARGEGGGRSGGAGGSGARPAPLDRLWLDDVTELVRAYFEELPPRQREIFDLADLQGYAPAEIAGMLEMNPTTVRANLFKARRTIRRRVLARHPELADGYGR